ncbi:MAG: hypothetical protein AB1916_06795 [Thermodesulfobacteriota bacterium]
MSRRVGVFRRLAALYDRMQREYDAAAAPLGFTCAGCPQNCCTSFFQHHTYVEWAYLWKGLDELPAERRDAFLGRARDYLDAARAALDRGETPAAMCPLNEAGRCALYSHRLMICRLHGVPHVLQAPGRARQAYPGCWRHGELAADRPDAPVLDRTPLYRELAALERDFLGPQAGRLPRADLTLAEMLVQGPPGL